MILLIDSYDSFTNNLAHLVKDNAHQEVIVIHNDSFKPEEYDQFFNEYLPLFDFLVFGPGPGHPSIESDVGIIGWLFRKYKLNPNLKAIPILGICLGFQSLCHEFGNEVKRLDNVRHGQVYEMYPIIKSDESHDPLFASIDSVSLKGVRYHSLYVESLNEELIPLAYCNDEGKKILMAVKHKKFPFYGVQYHPESICSSNGGDLIKDFNKIASEYNQQYRPNRLTQDDRILINKLKSMYSVSFKYLIEDGKFIAKQNPKLFLKKFQLDDNIGPVDVCDHLRKLNNNVTNFILLNSASFPGDWSMIGLPIPHQTEFITHSVDEPSLIHTHKYLSSEKQTLELENDETVWNYIGKKMKSNYISRESINTIVGKYNDREIPFFGGYMGIISYEEGQHINLEKLSSFCNKSTPDLKLAFIERFIAFDHQSKSWFLVSINPVDETKWGEDMLDKVCQTSKIDLSTIPNSVKQLAGNDQDKVKFELPNYEIYKKQFEACQEYLHSGDSYELCLTTPLKIELPSFIDPWDIYKILTLKKNPSPFSCYMEFSDCILISSSPERFLSWKQNELGNRVCQLRPIKGTVKNTPEVDYELATKILKTPKEMGENLMIVDLIRHDLFQFLEKVNVSQLMAVEEYKTVYQLVSVISGELYNQGYKGLDVLHNSLPPGSMTGAPKKRSVEILQDIEVMQHHSIPGGRRGLYSGVVGYLSVTDESDWSVIIRSVYHYSDDIENTQDIKLWRIGAGGAITVLSDVDGEWEEMELKLTSALQAFA